MTNLTNRIQYCQAQLKVARNEGNDFLAMLYERELESRLDQLAELRYLVEG